MQRHWGLLQRLRLAPEPRHPLGLARPHLVDPYWTLNAALDRVVLTERRRRVRRRAGLASGIAATYYNTRNTARGAAIARTDPIASEV